MFVLARPMRLARACSYATRKFAAQVRHRTDSSCGEPGKGRDTLAKPFPVDKILNYECILEFRRTASRFGLGTERFNVRANLASRDHRLHRHAGHGPDRT